MQYRRGKVWTERRAARTSRGGGGGSAPAGGSGRFGRAPRRRTAEKGAVAGVDAVDWEGGLGTAGEKEGAGEEEGEGGSRIGPRGRRIEEPMTFKKKLKNCWLRCALSGYP
jgi:hypothetical protein